MKFISLFAGVGGFDLALERAGHECVYANEWDKYCKIIYDKHFKIKLDGRSITEVTTDEIPDHDLLVGGFPCQSFSIAGKRGGFGDTRGTMFFEIARILQAKKPRLFILENVKGLLSHDNGATFKTIITTLTELGYDLQWQVLNSKNFGVPQNRERVFIIGHLRGTSRPKVFPIGQGYRTNENKGILAHTLNASDWRGANRNQQQTTIRQLNNPTHSNDRVYGADGISPTLNTMQGGMRQPKIYPMQWRRTAKGKETRKQNQIDGKDYTPFSDGCREVVPNPDKKVIGTITAQAIAKDSLLGNEHQIRRLTPLECERLQGFPDNWTEGVSDTQRYKMMGNAVTVNVVEYIIKNIP